MPAYWQVQISTQSFPVKRELLIAIGIHWSLLHLSSLVVVKQVSLWAVAIGLTTRGRYYLTKDHKITIVNSDPRLTGVSAKIK